MAKWLRWIKWLKMGNPIYWGLMFAGYGIVGWARDYPIWLVVIVWTVSLHCSDLVWAQIKRCKVYIHPAPNSFIRVHTDEVIES